MDGQELELLEGTVSARIYENEENGYTILRLDVHGEEVTVVGTMPGVASHRQVYLFSLISLVFKFHNHIISTFVMGHIFNHAIPALNPLVYLKTARHCHRWFDDISII